MSKFIKYFLRGLRQSFSFAKIQNKTYGNNYHRSSFKSSIEQSTQYLNKAFKKLVKKHERN